MTVTMDRTYGGKFEVLDVERRRRWTGDEKAWMVEETYAPGVTVSAVARRNGVSPSLLFRWRGLAQQGSLVIPPFFAGARSGAMWRLRFSASR